MGGASCIPVESEEVEESEEKTATTLSLSVQVPTAGGRKMGEKWWRAVVYVTVVGEAKTSGGGVC